MIIISHVSNDCASPRSRRRRFLARVMMPINGRRLNLTQSHTIADGALSENWLQLESYLETSHESKRAQQMALRDAPSQTGPVSLFLPTQKRDLLVLTPTLDGLFIFLAMKQSLFYHASQHTNDPSLFLDGLSHD